MKSIAIGGLVLIMLVVLVLGGQTPSPSGIQEINHDRRAERYTIHVATDKPIYRTSEKLYVRAVVLSATDHLPLTNPSTASFEIKGPKGDTVASGASTII